jgi:hypothetical protein
MGDRSRRTRRDSGGSGGGGSESLSALLDRFTTVDDKLEDTNDALQSVVRTNKAVAEALSALSGVELDLPSRNDLPLVADAVIEPSLADGVSEPSDYGGNTASETLIMPRDGYISEIVLVFPAGANQSVGIGVDGVNDESLVPFGPAGVNYIALDDESIDFSLDYDVNNDEEIEVRFINSRVATSQEDIADLTAYASALVTVSEEV